MPIYLYRCECCENETEQSNRVAERHTHAPVCGKNATHGHMAIKLTPNIGYVQRDCHYVCPVTRTKVTSNAQRRRIMDEHRLIDANDFPPEKAFAKAEAEKAKETEMIQKLKKDLTTGADRPFKESELHGIFPLPSE